MKKYDIVLLTESRYENPVNPDWYVKNILTEDGLVQGALEKHGLKVLRIDWNRKDFDWSSTKYALFRTTWDYFDYFKEFDRWLEQSSGKLTFINSYNIIRWNMDKNYLIDMSENGINIAPTHLIKKRESKTLKQLFIQTGWSEAILKPTIAGAARHTYKLTLDSLDTISDTYASLVQDEDFLLQEFQYNIMKSGELSLMLFGGNFSHAVLKIAKPGDFRVQDDFGGTVHEHIATDEEIEFAEKAVQACPDIPTYARVDIFRDNNNELALGELELIEPELWFRNKPEAADMLAQKIINQYFKN